MFGPHVPPSGGPSGEGAGLDYTLDRTAHARAQTLLGTPARIALSVGVRGCGSRAGSVTYQLPRPPLAADPRGPKAYCVLAPRDRQHCAVKPRDSFLTIHLDMRLLCRSLRAAEQAAHFVAARGVSCAALAPAYGPPRLLSLIGPRADAGTAAPAHSATASGVDCVAPAPALGHSSSSITHRAAGPAAHGATARGVECVGLSLPSALALPPQCFTHWAAGPADRSVTARGVDCVAPAPALVLLFSLSLHTPGCRQVSLSTRRAAGKSLSPHAGLQASLSLHTPGCRQVGPATASRPPRHE